MGLFKKSQQISADSLGSLGALNTVGEFSRYWIKLSPDDIEQGIGYSLELFCKLSGCPFAFYSLVNEQDNCLDDLHTWHQEGAQNFQACWQSMELDNYPWLKKQMFAKEQALVISPESLPYQAKQEKQFLQQRNIRKLLLLPLKCQESQISGLVGLSSQEPWPDEHEKEQSPLLMELANIMLCALKQKRFEKGMIKEKYMAEARLWHGTNHDQLTGLPNRQLFLMHLKDAIAQTEQDPNKLFAVLFLDFDRFKMINESLGYKLGDQLLQVFAKELSNCLRPGDVIARLGGDEFIVLLSSVKQDEDAIFVAERIQKRLTKPVMLGEQKIFSTVSIGITFSTNGYENPEEILRDADTAAYKAKKAGVPFEVFNKKMHSHAINRMEMEHDLRHAVERGELINYYQPIVCLNTGKITGFEVLIRWKHSEKGMIMPNDFIPLAEETGLIKELGQWVFEEACKQIRSWEKLGYGRFEVAVNFSAHQFMQSDLAQNVAHVVEQSHISPEQLIMEITETVAMNNLSGRMASLQELREMGVRISIDDFGTGYSSLSYLCHFPASKLKIDRSFVRDIENRDNMEITKAIIALAHSIDLSVVAEGVENESQLEFLKGQNCDHVQGYLLCRPLPAEEISAIISTPEGLKLCP